MSAWTSDELSRVGGAEELEIASARADGTLRQSRTIWVVQAGGEIYVRSVNGRDSDWFRGAQTRHAGRIEAGGVSKAVDFLEIAADDPVQDALDAAYASKYRRYAASIIRSITSAQARAATLRLAPRGDS